MTSDLFEFDFDGSCHMHSSIDMVSSEGGGGDLLCFSDPFSLLSDSTIDVFEISSNDQNRQNPLDDSPSLVQFSPSLLSSSPPSNQMENLSLYQAAAHVQPPLSNGPNLASEFGNLTALDALDVKTEEFQMGFDYSNIQLLVPHSYGGVENVAKFKQRSFSSNSFNGKPGCLFRPGFSTITDTPCFQNQSLSSPENSFFVGQMRRVCSTGDLQNVKANHTTPRSLSSPLATESPFLEEPNIKVGRYSAEERKEKISKYRAKRTQRNFHKTIKYACRKTLADNRPRVRGRFARNDETGEIPKAPCSTRDEDEDDLWFEGLHEEQEDGTVRAEQYMNCYGATQFQYYGF
ncbi:zinc finger protein CONSTANS-like [Quillaja saponaria]|uniref:Zinc finger protein CONSTANS-like n=1 Tax=Quillaja saponaria TaxID=32244 RepID=A0AAD7PEU0_QUISA|nr:zinc finger protein CONSTANS-like [Quillaja saponaria]